MLSICFEHVQARSVSMHNRSRTAAPRSSSSSIRRSPSRVPAGASTTCAREHRVAHRLQFVFSTRCPVSAACTPSNISASSSFSVTCDSTWSIDFRFHRGSRSISSRVAAAAVNFRVPSVVPAAGRVGPVVEP